MHTSPHALLLQLKILLPHGWDFKIRMAILFATSNFTYKKTFDWRDHLDMRIVLRTLTGIANYQGYRLTTWTFPHPVLHYTWLICYVYFTMKNVVQAIHTLQPFTHLFLLTDDEQSKDSSDSCWSYLRGGVAESIVEAVSHFSKTWMAVSPPMTPMAKKSELSFKLCISQWGWNIYSVILVIGGQQLSIGKLKITSSPINTW